MRRRTPVEALVQVGDVETRYVRAGQGPPVILLTDEDPAACVATPLFRSLASSFRVVSAAPCPAVPLGSWMLDLADGLGLDRPAVVVASRTSPEWVERVLTEVAARCGGDLGPVVRADPSASIPPALRRGSHRT